jgi:hypothetical protein
LPFFSQPIFHFLLKFRFFVVLRVYVMPLPFVYFIIILLLLLLFIFVLLLLFQFYQKTNLTLRWISEINNF